MAQSARPDRELEAQAAVQKAMEGNLPKIGEYKLQLSCENYSITVPPTAPRNIGASKGDALPAFVDYENGFVVYDLDTAGGDPDGGEC
jgi:hypothetical protein